MKYLNVKSPVLLTTFETRLVMCYASTWAIIELTLLWQKKN